MNTHDRKTLSKKLEKWSQYFVIICTLIGTALGSFLVYLFQGEFPYEVMAGGLAAAIILTIIQLVKHKRKKDNLPEADERVIHNVFRFLAFASHITLAVLFIGLAVFTLLGYDAIPMLYLWILFFVYIWVAGIGGLVIKRR
ncbi:hypothetical protein JNUCC1_01641 [Lentibacillus sp. JNUCC-1]|uniref:hypothetical protein n=1 Tax=Lentibacillus sp. JNUCC-1 TaxID=2654513 RepID=UPI0012E84A58|nr:hypothetical protein [Lentibacillus sp. JNUCC-1]MUV37835.1 hypothetical protein [Lentibacillus sp. JNUCC-1]